MVGQVSPDGSTEVEETAPGHFNVTCTKSGLPYVRANNLGMFCNGEPCWCEQESSKFGGPTDSPETIMRNMGLGIFLSGGK